MTIRKLTGGLILGLSLLAAACAQDNGNSANQAGNDPGGQPPYQPVAPNGQRTGDSNLFNLINRFSEGQVKNTPWAGYWFPYASDGTASALTKYEQATGNSGAANWEVQHHGTGVQNIQDWWGHCNGWCAAAVLHPEPKKPLTKNGVTFSVGDQKALMSEIGMEVDGDFFGHREDDPNDLTSLTFQDIFPNQFFLVLTNIVGVGQPLVIDRYTGAQVWNQPVVGYQIAKPAPGDYLGTVSGQPNVHRLMFQLQLWWARDDVDADHTTEPFTYADGPSYASRTLRGELWLDGAPVFDSTGNLTASGNIIVGHDGDYVTGGQWHNGVTETANSHPDYMWIPTNERTSSGYSNPQINPTQVKTFLGL